MTGHVGGFRRAAKWNPSGRECGFSEMRGGGKREFQTGYVAGGGGGGGGRRTVGKMGHDGRMMEEVSAGEVWSRGGLTVGVTVEAGMGSWGR